MIIDNQQNQPSTPLWKSWGASCLLWCAIGVIITLIADLSYASTRDPFDPAMWRRQMLFWVFFTPLTPPLFRLAGSVRLERATLLSDLTRAIGFGIVFVITHEILVGTVTYVFRIWDAVGQGASWLDQILLVAGRAWILEALIYGISFVVFFAAGKSRSLKERELEAASLQEKLAQAKLTSLKMQLQPHFLFNTLHTIGVLAKREPEESRRMITLLGDLLRATLESEDTQETTLRREISVLETFLKIEKVRFRDRLRVEFDVSREALDCSVPTLILQPLVENAVKHGIEKRAGEGSIRIAATVDEEFLILRVTDDGSGIEDDAFTERVGLGNTRERMQILYGTRQEFRLRSMKEGGVEAMVKIPRREIR